MILLFRTEQTFGGQHKYTCHLRLLVVTEMNKDTAEISLHSSTWESLASMTSSSNAISPEDRSCIELARLIQRNDEQQVSVEDQIRQEDALMKIASQNPGLLQQADREGLLPLHAAVENNAPLGMVEILATRFPNAMVVKYLKHGLQSVIRRARTAAVRDYLLEQALRYLHASLQDGWGEVQSFFTFHHDMVDVVQCLVNEFPGLMSKKGNLDDDWRTQLPLHYAVGNKAPIEILELLVSAYPKALTTKDSTGTPLHIACSVGHEQELQAMEILATPNALRVYDNAHMLPLHRYCERLSGDYNLQVVELMVKRYPKSVRNLDRKQMTPLHHVCRVPSVENLPVIQFLTLAYPWNLKVADFDGSTPLQTVCQWSQQDSLPVIQFLVEASPESAERLDSCGNTVLHRYCLLASHIELSIVEFLVNVYPDALQIKDKIRNLTPLHIAVEKATDIDVIRFMAHKCPEVLESDGDASGTPLHTVCASMEKLHWHGVDCNSECSCQDFRVRSLAILEIFLALSEKAVEARDSLRQSPLHILAREGSSRDFLKVLAERFPSAFSLKDCDGRIPLHIAVENCALEPSVTTMAQLQQVFLEATLQHLLEAFPLGVHIVDHTGKTPLMLACEGNVSLNVIYLLVKTDPISNRGLEWRQVPHERKIESTSRWRKILSAIVSNVVMG